jgi:hypothetical protein
MDPVKSPHSLLPSARANVFTPAVVTGAAKAAPEHAGPTPPTPAGNRIAARWSEVAGGTVRIVAAGGSAATGPGLRVSRARRSGGAGP